MRFAFPDECEEGSATLPNDAALAQLAEQLFCKQQVTGSIPVGGSSLRRVLQMDDDGPTTVCLPWPGCVLELASLHHMERIRVHWCRRGSIALLLTTQKTDSVSRSGCAHMTTGTRRRHSFAVLTGRARNARKASRLRPERLDCLV